MANDSHLMDLSQLAAALYYEKCRLKNNPMDILAVRFLLLFLYVSVFIVAVSGNALVIYVVMTCKRMQTVTNVFITNLAISDLLVNFTSLWLTPMYSYLGHWPWGGGLCHGLPLFQGTSIFISTLTLTAIAIDRYLVIVHHSQSTNINDRMSMRTCILIIALIWGSSLLLVMPYAVHMKTNFISSPCNFWMCSEDWRNPRLRSIYGTGVLILQFAVPFIIIGFSYISIWIFLNNRQAVRVSVAEMNRKKRLLRMLITMVVIFAVCWLPFNLMNILRDLSLDKWIKPYFNFAFLFIHLSSMSSTCWNAFIYAGTNDMFREEFARAIPFLKIKQTSRPRFVTDGCPATRKSIMEDTMTGNKNMILANSNGDHKMSNITVEAIKENNDTTLLL